MTHPAFAITTEHRLHDLAKAQAEWLRSEAMRDFGTEAVDDFWRGANAIWQRSQVAAQRSAARLQARLARRAQDRLAPTSAEASAACACQNSP